MIEWEHETREALNTYTRHYEKYDVWLMGAGPYGAVVRDNTTGYSVRVYARSNPDPTVTLFGIDLESAKKAAVDWIRNDLWTTLGKIGISTAGTTTAWGSGGSIPATSGTIYLKPNQLGGITWTYAQHNS